MSHRFGLFAVLFIISSTSTSSQGFLSNFISGVPEGVPGIDYPDYRSVPRKTSFTCRDRKPGFYADPDTRCQVWFWCDTFLIKHSFLCPNLTVFNQKIRGCDWWYNVDCTLATSQYVNNDELYKQSPEAEAKENARKEKELRDRQLEQERDREWWNRQQRHRPKQVVSEEEGGPPGQAGPIPSSSIAGINEADSDDAFTTTLSPDLDLFSPTPRPVGFRPQPSPSSPRPVTFAPAPVRHRTTFQSQAVTISRQPATLQPQPVTLAPRPVTFQPQQPAVIQPQQPAVIQPQPGVIQPQPGVIQPQPGVIQPQPGVIQPRPAAFQPQPVTFATLWPPQPQPVHPSATSPQWVPAFPPTTTTSAPTARQPTPFFFRPIAGAIPINFPTPARTRRPPTTPLPTSPRPPPPPPPPAPVATADDFPLQPITTDDQPIAGGIPPLVPVAPLSSLDTDQPAAATVASGRRRRPTTTIPPPPPPPTPLTKDITDVTVRIVGTTPSIESRRWTATSPPPALPSPTTTHRPQIITAAFTTPLRVHHVTTTTTTVAPVTTPSTTRLPPPSTVTSTLDDITTQVFDPNVAFGSRLEGSASENVFQSTEMPAAAAATADDAPQRRRKFVDGSSAVNVQTFPPFPVSSTSTTSKPEVTATDLPSTITVAAAILNRHRVNSAALRQNSTTESSLAINSEVTSGDSAISSGDGVTSSGDGVTSSVDGVTTSVSVTSSDGGVTSSGGGVTSSGDESDDGDLTEETSAATFASTRLAPITKKTTSVKPARTFPTFPITTFRPQTSGTEFGERDIESNDVTSASTSA